MSIMMMGGGSPGGAVIPSDSFKISINTENLGGSSSATKTFVLPAVGGPFDVTDWGDGSSDLEVSGSREHTYSSTGTYTITIDKFEDNAFQPCKFLNSGDKLKLLEIINWGNIVWNGCNSAFDGCSNMDIVASDLPSMSTVANIVHMFLSCSGITGEFPGIDFSSATNIGSIFNGCTGITGFNSGIDFSSASAINSAFNNCSGLISIPTFVFGNATTAHDLFHDCSSLIIFPAIDLSSVTGFNSCWKGNTSMTTVNLVDTSSGQNFSESFSGCTALVNLALINMHSMTNGGSTFNGVTLATADYSALLIDLAANNTNTSVTFNGGNSEYNASAVTARATLVDTRSWSISDGGLE